MHAGAVANRKASGEEAAEEKPRQKLSKKARLAAKKAERRAKRGAASDDDDMQLDIEGVLIADLSSNEPFPRELILSSLLKERSPEVFWTSELL